MKIVDRKTFLAMPEETVFAKYATLGNIGEVCIKGETYVNGEGEGIDFLYQPLANSVDANDTGAFVDAMAAAEKGAPFKLDLDCQSRDGLFDKDQLFVVWEPDDVKQLVERLQRCASAPNANWAAEPATEVLEVNVGGSALRALLCDTHTASVLAHLSGEHCELSWSLNTIGSSADHCDECRSSPQRGDTFAQRLERAIAQSAGDLTAMFGPLREQFADWTVVEVNGQTIAAGRELYAMLCLDQMTDGDSCQVLSVTPHGSGYRLRVAADTPKGRDLLTRAGEIAGTGPVESFAIAPPAEEVPGA